MRHLLRLRVDASKRRSDAGMTLTELLVAMLILLLITGAFFLMFGVFNTSANNTIALSEDQGTVRNVMRALESDLRSADPLLEAPTSFTGDANGSSSVGTNGTSSTDIVAMFSADDLFSPCGKTVSTPITPSPYVAQTFTANLIWAYDPGPGTKAGTLTRYSYCNSAWTAGMVLHNVKTKAKAMFSVTQSNTTLSTQQTVPTSTILNQSVPVCGTSVSASIIVGVKAQTTPFKTRVVVTLGNQPATVSAGCISG